VRARNGKTWLEAIRDGAVSGTLASVASAAALAACGQGELRNPATPLNGPSQWIWGRHAPWQDGYSLRYTVAGYAIHHAMSIFWAVLYEKWRGSPAKGSSAGVVVPATATSALACFVDYRLTPDRLTPGFEKRLSRRSLFVVYALFAAGLAAGTLLQTRK
jgi:hypothetical protein